MSYFQLVQEADMLKSQKKASLFILYFWLTLEVECQKSIVSHLLYREFSCSSLPRCANFARSFVLVRFPLQPEESNVESSALQTSESNVALQVLHSVKMDLKHLRRNWGIVSDVFD